MRKETCSARALSRNLVMQHDQDSNTGYATPKRKLKFGWEAFPERSSMCRHSQAAKIQKMQTRP